MGGDPLAARNVLRFFFRAVTIVRMSDTTTTAENIIADLPAEAGGSDWADAALAAWIAEAAASGIAVEAVWPDWSRLDDPDYGTLVGAVLVSPVLTADPKQVLILRVSCAAETVYVAEQLPFGALFGPRVL